MYMRRMNHMPRPRKSKINEQAALVLWAVKHAQRPLTYPEIREYIYINKGIYVENVSGRMGELRRLHRIHHDANEEGVRRYTYVGPLAAPKTTAPMPRITLPEGFTEEQAERVYRAALREIARIQGETPAAAEKDWWDLDLFVDDSPSPSRVLRGVRR
jgi:hypothetical protein